MKVTPPLLLLELTLWHIGNDSPEAFDRILQGYQSVVDSPVAVKPEEVYAAYPNAKFILASLVPFFIKIVSFISL